MPHGYPSALQQSLDDVNAQLVRLAGANVAPLVPARLEALVTKTALDAFASKGVTPLPQVVVRLWPVAAGGHAVGRAPPRCAAATASAADDADDHQQRTTKQGGDVPPVLILICKGLFKVSFQPKAIIARDHVLSTPTTENKVSRFLQDRK